MTVQCVYCANFNLQNADGHNGRLLAEQGYGTCNKQPATGHYESAQFERHCRMFARAPLDTCQQRICWLFRKRKEFLNQIKAIQAKDHP